MLLLDITFRFATITILLLTAGLAYRDARHLLQGRLAIGLSVSLASMLAHTLPSELNAPDLWRTIAWIMHMPNITLLWLFGLSLLIDGFRIKPLHWALVVGHVCVLTLSVNAFNAGYDQVDFYLTILNRMIGLGVLAHLFVTAVRGYGDDLVEGRRRTRLWFMVFASIAALVIVGGETAQYFITGAAPDPEWFKVTRVLIIFPLTVFTVQWILHLQPEQFLFEQAPQSVVAEPAVDPKDFATHKHLLSAMEDQKLYREHGLGIGDLASKLSVPEHQLRALINKGLGYRNFAAFLNTYRLAEAKAALADPEQARTPILTIAMDAGYASLATFNRAFKSEEGVTPSSFRADALAKAAQT